MQHTFLVAYLMVAVSLFRT